MKNIFNTNIETLIEQGRAYTIIPKDIIRNRKLSESARLILLHLLSSDPAISIHSKLISRWTGIPIKRTRQAIEELESAGYMRRVHHHRTRKEPYGFQWQITDTAGSMSGSPGGMSPLGRSRGGRAPTGHTKSRTCDRELPTALNAHEDNLRSRPAAFNLSDENPASAGIIQSPQKGENCPTAAHAPVASRGLKTASQDTIKDNQENLQETNSKTVINVTGDPEDYQEYPGYTVGKLDSKCYRDGQNVKMVRTLWESYQTEKGNMISIAGGTYTECNPVVDAKTLSAFIHTTRKTPGKIRKVCHILNALTFFIRSYGSDCFSDFYNKRCNRRTVIKNNFPEAYKCIAGLNYAKELEKKLPELLKLLENDAFKQAALDTFPVYIKVQEQKATRMGDYIGKLAKPPKSKLLEKTDMEENID